MQKTPLNSGLKTPYLGIFGLQFWKAIAMFEINNLKFIKLQSFIQNKKTIKLRSKMSFLRIF